MNTKDLTGRLHEIYTSISRLAGEIVELKKEEEVLCKVSGYLEKVGNQSPLTPSPKTPTPKPTRRGRKRHRRLRSNKSIRALAELVLAAMTPNQPLSTWEMITLIQTEGYHHKGGTLYTTVRGGLLRASKHPKSTICRIGKDWGLRSWAIPAIVTQRQSPSLPS